MAPPRRTTAVELARALAADPDYRAGMAAQAAAAAELKPACAADEVGLLTEVRAAGAPVRSVCDFVYAGGAPPAAVPILLARLRRAYHPRVWEGIVRALSGRARPRCARASDVPRAAAVHLAPPEVVGVPRPDLGDPAAHGLVADANAALGQQLLHVADAQRKRELEADGVGDHLARNAVAAVPVQAIRHGRTPASWKAPKLHPRSERDSAGPRPTRGATHGATAGATGARRGAR